MIISTVSFYPLVTFIKFEFDDDLSLIFFFPALIFTRHFLQWRIMCTDELILVDLVIEIVGEASISAKHRNLYAGI